MPAFDKLDAWKCCHELTLASYNEISRAAHEQDPDITWRLRYCAMRAAGRIAFGAGSGDRKIALHAASSARGWLAEFGSLLELAHVMGVLSAETRKKLDALRGRATFYTSKWWEQQLGPAPGS